MPAACSTSTPAAAPSASSPSTGVNLAWIAGPIIGGIICLALIALLIFLLVRRGAVASESKSNSWVAPPTAAGAGPGPEPFQHEDVSAAPDPNNKVIL